MVPFWIPIIIRHLIFRHDFDNHPSTFEVVEVQAHRKPHEATGLLDAWQIVGNDKAESLAKATLWEVAPRNGINPSHSKSFEIGTPRLAHLTSEFLHVITIKTDQLPWRGIGWKG